jgi:GTP-binding protein
LSSEVDIVRQDETIIQHILEQKKALILVLSKIDLLNEQELRKWQKDARAWLPYVKWAPIVSLSVSKKKGIDELLHQIKKVNHEYHKKLSTQDINHFIGEFQNGQVSPIVKGKRAKMYYGVQTDTNPPTFTIFTNNADLFRFSFVRALENSFREYFGFQGSPIVFNYKSKRDTSPNPFN